MGPEPPLDRAIGYAGVDIVAVSSRDFGQNRPLREWVNAGGTAMILGTADGTGNPDTGGLLPVIPLDTVGIPASSILGKPGYPGAVTAIRCETKPGARVIAEYQGMPLVVERPLGLGKVVYVAFDTWSPALRDSIEYAPFWGRVLHASASRGQVLDGFTACEPYRDRLAAASSAGMNISPPRVGLMAGFFGLYVLLLVPVNYYVLKKLRRKEWAWVTIPALVMVFSVSAYCVGSMNRDKHVKLQTIAVAETAAGSDVAAHIGRVSLFSPSKDAYDMEFAGPPVVVSDVESDESRSAWPALQVVEDTASLLLPDTDVYMWSTRTLVVRGIGGLGGKVSADLITDGTRVRGVITNGFPFTLRHATLYGERLRQEIGVLKPGQAFRVDCELRDGAAPKSMQTEGVPWPYGESHLGMREQVRYAVASNVKRSGDTILVAWMDAPLWQLSIPGADAAAKDVSAILIHIRPEWRPRSNGQIAGSVGFRAYQVIASDDGGYRRGDPGSDGEARSLTVGLDYDTVIADFELPIDGYSGVLDRLSLTCDVGMDTPHRHPGMRPRAGWPVQATVQAYDYHAGTWRRVSDIADPGALRLPIGWFKDAVGPGGIVRVRFTENQNGKSPFLQVDNLRLEFEGRMK